MNWDSKAWEREIRKNFKKGFLRLTLCELWSEVLRVENLYIRKEYTDNIYTYRETQRETFGEWVSVCVRERERWWAQEEQIEAKKLLGWWPFMRPSEASVSTQTGLTQSSGLSVLARTFSEKLSLSISILLCLLPLIWVLSLHGFFYF